MKRSPLRRSRTAIPRTKRPKRKVRVKRRSAKHGEKQRRAMGTAARRKFVQSLPCAACGVVGYSVNAHVLGVAGIGLKKAHTTIAPLCGPHDVVVSESISFASFEEPPFRTSDKCLWPVVGCHALYDRQRWTFDAEFPTFNAEQAAADTQSRWLAFRGAQDGDT